MYEAAVVVSTLLIAIATYGYIRLACERKTKPVPATWILMTVSVWSSFAMYWNNPNHSWTSNLGITMGVLNISAILFYVLLINYEDKTLRVAFDRVQRYCLLAGEAVFFFWLGTSQDLVAYILTQLIGVIAYVATVQRLWKADSMTEPVVFWALVLVAVILAGYPAYVKNDTFAWIYLARAVPSTLLLIYLIRRVQSKMKEAQIQ